MLVVAIIIALFLIYLLNSQKTPVAPSENTPYAKRRVGGAFAYSDMFDLSQDDEMPINTVTGPGGGSLVKKFV